MENDTRFRSLEETGFHTSSEHQELSSNMNALNRLYGEENQGMDTNPSIQSFGISLNVSQGQDHFNMMSHPIPGHSGVPLGSYALHISNEPLPPPQSPQFLNNENMFRTVTNMGQFTSPISNPQISHFFIQSNSPGEAGKVKCIICPKDSQSIPLAGMARHFSTMHPTSGIPSHRRTPPPGSPRTMTSESRRNFVSKHFLPINLGPNKGKKKCSSCDIFYSSTTSSSILSRHLSKVHRINPKVEVEHGAAGASSEGRSHRPPALSRSASSPSAKEKSAVKGPAPSQVWAHFAQIDVANKDGSKHSVKKCHHCEKSYSVNTSNSGLARHLFSVHSIRLPCFVTVPSEDSDNPRAEEPQVEFPDKAPPREAEEDAFECDAADGFPLPAANAGKESPSQADVVAPFFTMEASADGVSLLKKCRQCGRLFDISSPGDILLQHLSSHSLPQMEPEEPLALPAEAFPSANHPSGAQPEERNLRLLQMLLSKFVLSNPEPLHLLQNPHFQELVHCFDRRVKCPSLEECKQLAAPLDGIRNLPVIPSTEASPVWSHFLEQNSSRQCLYCHFVFPNATSTFGLTRHLGSAHSSLFPSGFPPPPRAAPSEGIMNSLHSLLARFLITDMRPASLLDQELFQKFLVLLGLVEPPFATRAVAETIAKLYREQSPRIEALLKSALSRVTLVVDLFDLKNAGSVLVVSFSFVDCDWKPRRIVASANWYTQAIRELDLDALAKIVLYNSIRCNELQLRVACFLVNARVRGAEFKGLLEQRLRERHDPTPLLRCVSAMIDDSLTLAMQDHPISSRLRRLPQPREALGGDWRALQETLSNNKLLLAELSTGKETMSQSEWDELCFFLSRLSQVQRAAHSLYDSCHVTLSEAYVALKGLSDQLFDFVDPSQPQIGRLIESLSEFTADSSEPLMHLTTFLDPRFKLRVFGDRASTVLRLKKMLAAFPLQEDGTSHASLARPTFASVAASFFSPRPPFPEVRVPQGLDAEFSAYLHSPPIEPQMSPLQWWLAHHIEFPILHRIALEHLAIPASGLFLLPEQNKLTAFSSQGSDLLPILAMWAQNRYSH